MQVANLERVQRADTRLVVELGEFSCVASSRPVSGGNLIR